MIAVDTNLLVYAHRRDMVLHEPATAALRTCAEGTEAWALPWPCVHEFLAIVTNPKVFKKPSTMEQALSQLRAWLGSPTLVLLRESDDHFEVLARVLVAAKVNGAKVHDARIAALCVAHEVRELWSADRDFTRFAGVRTRNPLV